VITGNWGNDLALLIKAAKEGGLSAQIHAPIANLIGTPTMIGESGADRVRAVVFWHPNAESTQFAAYATAFKQKYKEDFYWLPIHTGPEMLRMAMEKAGSDDPLKVALALEGLRYDSPIGEMWMRPEDHQLIAPLYQVVFTKIGQAGVKYDAEDTGYGWKTEYKLEMSDFMAPPTCKVQRP
jgi:branched-chain amino acid transport system substrate-binding protein